MLLFAAFSFVAYGQTDKPPPTAELMHFQVKETYPAFIVITNTAQLAADASDYYFTYDADMFCRGGYYATYDYARGFGTDPNTYRKEGFSVGEQMFLGFYDSSGDKYYDLEINKELSYGSLALYMVNAHIGEEIELNVNPELVQSSITFDYIPTTQDIYRDENVFLDIESENIKDLTIEVTTGGGTLEKVKRWIKNPGKFVNYVYHSVDTDSLLMVKASGTGRYSGDPITEIGIVILTNSKPTPPDPEPGPEPSLVFENEYIKITKENFRIFGMRFFIENLQDTDIDYYIWLEPKEGRTTSNRGEVSAGEKERIRVRGVDYYNKIEKIRLTVGNQIVWVTDPVNL